MTFLTAPVSTDLEGTVVPLDATTASLLDAEVVELRDRLTRLEADLDTARARREALDGSTYDKGDFLYESHIVEADTEIAALMLDVELASECLEHRQERLREGSRAA